MSKADAVLSAEEEIQKALANLQNEDGFLSKAEDGEEEGSEEEEEEEGSDNDEDNTNANVEEGEGEEEEEEVSKGFDGYGLDEDIQKSIDMHPILQNFDARMSRMENAILGMAKQSGLVMKGMNDKLNDLNKGMEDIANWSSGRKSMGARPEDRFEKSQDGEMQLHPVRDKQVILKSIEGQAFNGNEVVNRNLADAIVMYESSNTVSKAIEIACAKENISLIGGQF